MSTVIHPQIADRRRRVVRTRFELRRVAIEERVVPLLQFAREAGCDMRFRGAIMRTLALESIKIEAAEAAALTECN